jgi:hypothetical protein
LLIVLNVILAAFISGKGFFMFNKITFITFLSLSLISGFCSAEDVGWYIGGSIGEAEADLGSKDFSIFDDGSITSSSFDDSGDSYSFFVGVQNHENFAAEFGYIDFGEGGFNATSDGLGTMYVAGPVKGVLESDAITVAVKPILPLTEHIDLFAKIGVFFWDSQFTLSDSAQSASASEDGEDLFYGLGAGLNFGSFTLTAEYTRYDLDGVDVDVVAASAIIRF